MSRYRAGWLAITAFAAALPCWAGIAVVFLPPERFGIFLALSLLLWLPAVVSLALFPRCPTCRTSVFTAYEGRWLRVARAWPSRRCSVCGTKLDGESSS